MRQFTREKSEYFQCICHIDQRIEHAMLEHKGKHGYLSQKTRNSIDRTEANSTPVINESTLIFLYMYRRKQNKTVVYKSHQISQWFLIWLVQMLLCKKLVFILI